MKYTITRQHDSEKVEVNGTNSDFSILTNPDQPNFELWVLILDNLIGYVSPKLHGKNLVLISEVNRGTWLTSLDFESEEELRSIFSFLKFKKEEDEFGELFKKISLEAPQAYKENAPFFDSKEKKSKCPYYNKNRPF